MSFGEKMKERRLELKISQSKLAKLCGISQSKISDYERGAHMPRESLIMKICSVLKTKPYELMIDKAERKAEQQGYRRMLIKTAINFRIDQEAKALAKGMEIEVEEVMKIWKEENKKCGWKKR